VLHLQQNANVSSKATKKNFERVSISSPAAYALNELRLSVLQGTALWISWASASHRAKAEDWPVLFNLN
jgi:hypothetical protein